MIVREPLDLGPDPGKKCTNKPEQYGPKCNRPMRRIRTVDHTWWLCDVCDRNPRWEPPK